MIEVIVNLSNLTAHIREDGKTFEECNIDQIQQKALSTNHADVRAAAEFAQNQGWTLCERCFYDIN